MSERFDTIDNADENNIREQDLAEALGERYLAYALSTITSRSLPDARDGLKPVHRRLLVAMRELKLDPKSGFKKCARIVGDVMGKLHPHGDQAIYDALVRLAQDFSSRYPLIDGQGNFGTIDGDNAAAMRYTEARMTFSADYLLQGLDDDSVDFRPTYDNESDEPTVLPAAFPQLLANGASGIAVGLATNIPPHNILELCDALLLLIKKPNCTTLELMEHIQGPDFPTGGILAEDQETIAAAYESGRGSFRLRANYQIDRQKGGGVEIIIDQIPYQVTKSRLVERLADLALGKSNPLLGDVRDESAEDLRLVLVPRARTVDPDMLMASLFRQTELETRYSLNMNMLTDDGRIPRLLGLKAALQQWLDHRHQVLIRRLNHRKAAIEQRLHLLDGYLIAFLDLDQVIRIIRDEDSPKAALMQRFSLSDIQAEAILNLRLRALRRLEEMALKQEKETLTKERQEIDGLLTNEALRWKALAGEVKSLKADYEKHPALSERRTQVVAPDNMVEFVPDTMIEREPVTIFLSKKDWIRSVRGHLDAEQCAQIKYKDGDEARFCLHAHTTDKLLIVASNGRVYTLGADKLPGGRGMGEPVRLMITLDSQDSIVALNVFDEKKQLLLASDDGRGFLSDQADLVAQTRNGKQIMSLPATSRLCATATVEPEDDSIAVIGSNRKLLCFARSEVPVLGRGRGVLLQKYKGDRVSDIKGFQKAQGLSWRSGERTRTETALDPWYGKRGQTGRLPPSGFARTNRFS